MITKILSALIGYAGSSEDPSKMSMRMMAIVIVLVGKVTAMLALAGVVLPYTDAQTQSLVGSLAMVVASLMWVVGAVRAMINAARG